MNQPASSLKQQLASQQLAALQAENQKLRSELEAWQNNVMAAEPIQNTSPHQPQMARVGTNWLPLVLSILFVGWAALQWLLGAAAETILQQQVADTRTYGSLIVAAILYHKFDFNN